MKKEKRVKKPLQIACNGQYYISIGDCCHDEHDEDDFDNNDDDDDEQRWLI